MNRPRCQYCGDIVGVYERIWALLPDGRLESTSLINLHNDECGFAGRLWHHHCLPPETARQPA